MVTWLVGIVHVLVSFVLIALILLKSGRGGGLSDVFGGGATGGARGSTVVERNLDRFTIIVGVLFAFTTVILALRLT